MIKGQNKGNPVIKIQSVKQRVIIYLQADPSLRDNDERLVANFWHFELLTRLKKDPQEITAKQLLNEYSKGNLTSADLITRARRRAQEEYPELRGNTWEVRQGLSLHTKDRINAPEFRDFNKSKK